MGRKCLIICGRFGRVSKMEGKRNVYSNPEQVEAALQNWGIYVDRRVVTIPESEIVGLKLWGMIDYLIHHAKYADCWLRIPDKGKSRRERRREND